MALLTILSAGLKPTAILTHLTAELHLQAKYEVLRGLVLRVEDDALVTEANQPDVLHF